MQTPLHALHVARGAKFVDFAGWEMPLHYGSQIAEHHAVRAAAGLFDISHMRALDVLEAHTFLRRALANDVAKLARPGQALYSCLLDTSGGILDDLIVYRLDGTAYRLVVNAATAADDVAWLRSLGNVPILERTDLAMIALQGPLALAKIQVAFPDWNLNIARMTGIFQRDWFVARTGYTGEDGLEIMLPAPYAQFAWTRLEAAGCTPCGLGARDTLRLEAGLRLYGQDMDRSVTPDEAGLGWTIDRSAPREFIGRKALDARSPRFRHTGLVLQTEGVLRAGQQVSTAHGAGRVTSGTFAPTLRRSIALARLPAACTHGEPVTVDIRGRAAAAVVVTPPFVRNGRSML